MSTEPRPKGYEESDVPPSPVVVAIASLVALMLAGFFGGWLFQAVFEATEVKTRPEPNPLSQREPVQGPLLQAHPEVELEAYLEEQRTILSSYAWVDRAQGVVRIPVERAMEIIARDGFPKWAPVTAKLPEASEGVEAEGGSAP